MSQPGPVYDLTLETCPVRGPQGEYCGRVPYHDGKHRRWQQTQPGKNRKKVEWDDPETAALLPCDGLLGEGPAGDVHVQAPLADGATQDEGEDLEALRAGAGNSHGPLGQVPEVGNASSAGSSRAGGDSEADYWRWTRMMGF